MNLRARYLEALNALKEENNKFRKIVLKEPSAQTKEENDVLKEPLNFFMPALEKLQTFSKDADELIKILSPEDEEQVKNIFDDAQNNMEIAILRVDKGPKIDPFDSRSVSKALFKGVFAQAELQEKIAKCKEFEAKHASKETTKPDVTMTAELDSKPTPKSTQDVMEDDGEEIMNRIRRTRC